MSTTIAEILAAVKAELEALEWSPGVPVLPGGVHVVANLDAGIRNSAAVQMPAALLYEEGARYSETDNAEIVVTTVSIGLLYDAPLDHTHTEALMGTRGLYSIAEQVRAAIGYSTLLNGEAVAYWTAESANVSLAHDGSPGDPVVRQMRFEVEHQ